MFVLYTRLSGQFCVSVDERWEDPEFNWSPWLADSAHIEHEADAVHLATEVQRLRRKEGRLYLDCEVLRLLPDGRPDFNNPVLVLPQWRDVH